MYLLLPTFVDYEFVTASLSIRSGVPAGDACTSGEYLELSYLCIFQRAEKCCWRLFALYEHVMVFIFMDMPACDPFCHLCLPFPECLFNSPTHKTTLGEKETLI